MGKVIGSAWQRLKPGCCLQLCVICVVEKEETLLNHPPCALGILNYCLYCTGVLICCVAVETSPCLEGLFLLMGFSLYSFKGELHSGFLSLFYFIFFFKYRAYLLCRANIMQVTASSCARRPFCPAVRAYGVRACQRCLGMCRWQEPGLPLRCLR